MQELNQFLSGNRAFFHLLHLFGFTIGMGSAFLADFFLLRYIRSSKFTQENSDNLQAFSKAVWLGLAILIISGAALTIPHWQSILNSPKFQVKLLATMIVAVNGVALNAFISPKLIKIFSTSTNEKYKKLRKLSFALGAVSITSWLVAFTLGGLRNLEINFLPLLVIYLGMLILTIICSQFVEKWLFKFRLK